MSGLVIGILMSLARDVGFPIVVDFKQFRGPTRAWMPWPRRVAWSNVRGVEWPGHYSRFVTLRLANGERWEFGLPAAYLRDVARIGRIPLADDPGERR